MNTTTAGHRPTLEPRAAHLAGLPDDAAGEHDALADLFLSETTPQRPALRLAAEHAPAPSADAAPAGVLVEGLVLGHLPVLAAAWVLQYAKHTADTARTTVALLRVQGGQVWVDLVLPRGSTPVTSSRVGAPAPAPDLHAAVAQASREASRWMLRVDDVDEPELLSTDGLTCVTLLTGTDVPAVVASYRTLKNLCQDGAAEAKSESVPRVRLAIMGADDASAAEAEAKITKASQTFLGGPIPCTARVGKIGACTTQALFRGPGTPSLAELTAMIASSRHTPATVAPPATPEAVDVGAPVVMTITAAPTVELKPEASWAPALLGFTGLSARCPVAPEVTLAQGADGTLHLITTATASPGSCVGSLLAAASWAEQNAALLEAAYPDALRGLADRGPALHVLVEDARAARALLDTGVRVHLVIQAEVDGRSLRLARELN